MRKKRKSLSVQLRDALAKNAILLSKIDRIEEELQHMYKYNQFLVGRLFEETTPVNNMIRMKDRDIIKKFELSTWKNVTG